MNWRQAILSADRAARGPVPAAAGRPGRPRRRDQPSRASSSRAILGALCLILFLFATQIIPVNWAGRAAILLAIGLFAAEVKVTSYGLLTVGGIVAMILGAMMLVDAPHPGAARRPLRRCVPAALAMAAGTIALVRLVVQAQRRRPLTGRGGPAGAARPWPTPTSTRRAGCIVQGERWRAVAEERGRARASGGGRVASRACLLRVRKGA